MRVKLFILMICMTFVISLSFGEFVYAQVPYALGQKPKEAIIPNLLPDPFEPIEHIRVSWGNKNKYERKIKYEKPPKSDKEVKKYFMLEISNYVLNPEKVKEYLTTICNDEIDLFGILGEKEIKSLTRKIVDTEKIVRNNNYDEGGKELVMNRYSALAMLKFFLDCRKSGDSPMQALKNVTTNVNKAAKLLLPIGITKKEFFSAMGDTNSRDKFLKGKIETIKTMLKKIPDKVIVKDFISKYLVALPVLNYLKGDAPSSALENAIINDEIVVKEIISKYLVALTVLRSYRNYLKDDTPSNALENAIINAGKISYLIKKLINFTTMLAEIHKENPKLPNKKNIKPIETSTHLSDVPVPRGYENSFFMTHNLPAIKIKPLKPHLQTLFSRYLDRYLNISDRNKKVRKTEIQQLATEIAQWMQNIPAWRANQFMTQLPSGKLREQVFEIRYRNYYLQKLKEKSGIREVFSKKNTKEGGLLSSLNEKLPEIAETKNEIFTFERMFLAAAQNGDLKKLKEFATTAEKLKKYLPHLYTSALAQVITKIKKDKLKITQWEEMINYLANKAPVTKKQKEQITFLFTSKKPENITRGS